MIRVLPLSKLPTDQNHLVFFELDAHNLAKCCQVSKTWQQFASNDLLWSQCIPGISKVVQCDIRNYINSHAITPSANFENRFEEFLQEVKVEGRMKVIFPFKPEWSFLAELRYGDVELNMRDPALNKVYVCMENSQEQNTPIPLCNINEQGPFNGKDEYYKCVANLPSEIVGPNLSGMNEETFLEKAVWTSRTPMLTAGFLPLDDIFTTDPNPILSKLKNKINSLKATEAPKPEEAYRKIFRHAGAFLLLALGGYTLMSRHFTVQVPGPQAC